MWFKKSLGAFAALALVLAACSTPSGSSSGEPSASGPAATDGGSAPTADQVLRVDIGGEPPSLDPTQATDSASIVVLRSITYPLAYFDENLAVVPGLAESWDISEDGTQITYHLKDGITYSNGDPIVAGDFVYSWKRLIDPRVAAGYSYIMADVVGGEDLLGATCLEIAAEDPPESCDEESEVLSDADIDGMLDAFGVSAPDDQTFVVDLARPAAYFVYISALWTTVPLQQSWVESEGFTEAENYVSSGPMQLDTWEHNARIVLTPNPNWNGDEVTIDRVEMSMIQDPAASLAAYEADELDLGSVPSEEVPRIQDDPELSQEVLTGDVLSIYYMGYDLKNPDGIFTKSVNMRHAFDEAVDKETMIATTFSGIGTVACGLVPPGMPGFQDCDTIGNPYDVDKAKADFQAGLDELGLTADTLPALEIGFNTDANHEAKVDFLVEQWRQAFGVEVSPVGLEWGAYLDRLAEDPFDIFRLGWGADYPHPNNFLTDLISCQSGNNNMGYCNEDVDALLQEAAVTPDLEDQVPIYNQAQEMVMEDTPIIPLRFATRFSLVKPWVGGGFAPTAQDSQVAGELFFYKVEIADH
jgi:oligopeptide transport system substrate-binding protein